MLTSEGPARARSVLKATAEGWSVLRARAAGVLTKQMYDCYDSHEHRRREDYGPEQLHHGFSGHLVPPGFV